MTVNHCQLKQAVPLAAKKVEELTRVQKNLETQLKEYRDVERLKDASRH